MTEIALGGYPAKQCPRLTHNDNSPLSPPRPPVDEGVQGLFDAGLDFEADITSELVATLGVDVLYLDEEALGWDGNVAATMDAMRRRVPVIVNGRLPSIEGRTGAPDVLVLVEGGYLPVDVKNHRTLGSQKSRTLTYSTLNDPATRQVVDGRSGDGSHRGDDTMQLAHYTRMLQALGFHPGGPGDQSRPELLLGGIIGTSDFTDITGQAHAITWYDLTTPQEVTYSATAEDHRRRRSALERYDHEFSFRLKVAQVARSGGELVRPIGTYECLSCPWQAYCAEVAGEDDPTFAITAGRLDAREWLFVQAHGGDSLEGLAALDVAALAPEFASHSVSRRTPEERLDSVVQRARMTLAGVDYEPRSEWPEIPAADVEVDFDIEWDRDGFIYQWGLRIRQGQDESTAVYEPVLSFEALDEAKEAELAEAFADELGALIDAADAAGKSLRIYHWHNVEVTRTAKFPRVARLLEGRCTDLLAWFNSNFRARGSSSLKDVAPLFGFAWDVDDAGGYTSMLKIEQARTPEGAEDRAWCLRYNESDTAAQPAIRDGLRQARTEATALAGSTGKGQL